MQPEERCITSEEPQVAVFARHDDRHSTSSQGSDGKAFEAKYNSLCKMALDNEDQCYEAMDLLGELVSVEGHSDRLFDILERIQEQIMRL